MVLIGEKWRDWERGVLPPAFVLPASNPPQRAGGRAEVKCAVKAQVVMEGGWGSKKIKSLSFDCSQVALPAARGLVVIRPPLIGRV